MRHILKSGVDMRLRLILSLCVIALTHIFPVRFAP